MGRVLAGDIGGTKTLLCLGETDTQGRFRVLAQRRYASAGHASFDTILTDFLRPWGEAVTAACFGVAGPVQGGVCRTTNLPWILEAAALSRRLGGASVHLLNDLEAAGYGILELPSGRFADLNPRGRPRKSAHRAVIAAGTGLGEALLIHGNGGVTVVPTEGGHCDFAPRDAWEDALLVWLRKRYSDHVSYERVVSGPGLVNIYRFLRAQGELRESPEVATALRADDAARVVGEWGLRGDPLCLEALRRFAVMYGAEAGNLALKSLACGGVYLAGGIAPKLLPFLQRGDFMAGFVAKGRYRSLLETIPVRVVLFEKVVLLGALAWLCERVLQCPREAVYNGLLQANDDNQGDV